MKGSMTGAIFLDIEVAYDNVLPHILFDSINEFRIPNGYKSFFLNFLGHKMVDFYESGQFISRRKIYKGLPQGSVLEPCFV